VVAKPDQSLLQIDSFGDRGILCTEFLLALFEHPEHTQPPDCFGGWPRNLEILTAREDAHPAIKSYAPGQVANETRVSRIISFSSGEPHGQFEWTKLRKWKAIQSRDDPRVALN
jgi:hypothetical protein